MRRHYRTEGQFLLPLYKFIILRSCKTEKVYEMLRPFLDKGSDRGKFIQLLDRLSRNGKSYELEVNEGLWIVQFEGKQGRKYCCNLLFKPLNILAS
jgi:hypothetical protein